MEAPALTKTEKTASLPERLTLSATITELVLEWCEGNEQSLNELVTMVYQQLRQTAERYLRGESGSHTLPPTALINEVYLRFHKNKAMRLGNRTQFFWFAGQLMRQILVDHARAKRANKRSHEGAKITLDPELGDWTDSALGVDALLSLNEALDRLAVLDSRQATIVELRFFTGLSLEEVAEPLNLSATTIKREWQTAKRWLGRELSH